MKLVKTLVLTTALTAVAFSASATKNFEGGYLGAQIGAAKAGQSKSDTVDGVPLKTLAGSKNERKWGLHGGVLGGYRTAVSQDVVLGASLGVDFEKVQDKEIIANRDSKNEAKRDYVVNLLGQAGYTVNKNFMPFVTAGVSMARFNLFAGDNNDNLSKKFTKFGVAAGVGAAYAFNETVSTDIQYLYTYYGNVKKSFRLTAPAVDVVLHAPKAFHAITVGLKVNI